MSLLIASPSPFFATETLKHPKLNMQPQSTLAKSWMRSKISILQLLAVFFICCSLSGWQSLRVKNKKQQTKQKTDSFLYRELSDRVVLSSRKQRTSYLNHTYFFFNCLYQIRCFLHLGFLLCFVSFSLKPNL